MTTVVPGDLDFSQAIFPNNAINVIAVRFGMFTNLNVVKRTLRRNDPNLSIGISALTWLPVPNSQEMKGMQSYHSASLEQYIIQVEAFVRDTDEERGLATHSVLAEMMRTTLGDDAPLRAQLGGLEAVFGNTTKVLQRFHVRSGRYASGILQGAFSYLTTSELVLEVEKR